MKVHLIKKKSIFDFIEDNPRSRAGLNIWLNLIKYADWKAPIDITNTFGSADILGQSSNRVIFNIGGNKYRIICLYYFSKNSVHLFVKWIGTHADYDELCSKNLQLKIDNYSR